MEIPPQRMSEFRGLMTCVPPNSFSAWAVIRDWLSFIGTCFMGTCFYRELIRFYGELVEIYREFKNIYRDFLYGELFLWGVCLSFMGTSLLAKSFSLCFSRSTSLYKNPPCRLEARRNQDVNVLDTSGSIPIVHHKAKAG